MRFVLLFLLFPHILFSHLATTENDPHAMIEGCVSAITGELYLSEEDLRVAGAEPIHYQRSFLSSSGEWRFFDHLIAEYTTEPMIPGPLVIREPNGTALTYRIVFPKNCTRKQLRQSPQIYRPVQGKMGLTNTSRGEISGRTNLLNQYVIADENGFVCHCPDGTKRTFVLGKGQKKPTFGSIHKFLLVKEELLNGNQILYQWNDSRELVSIRTVNPSGEVYATLDIQNYKEYKQRFLRHPKVVNFHFSVRGSDGSSGSYLCQHVGKTWVLEDIDCWGRPREQITYAHGKHPRIERVTRPDGRMLQIEYDQSGRVAVLRAPVGKTSSGLFRTYSLHYYPHERRTTVTDSRGIQTKYYWDDHYRLIKIERQSDTKHTIHNTSLFTWDTQGKLICKQLLDSEGRWIDKTTYTYDDYGNILQEILTGDLTGKGNRSDFYAIRYTYTSDNKHLPLTKKEDNGLETRYQYHKNTNLLRSVTLLDRGTIVSQKTYSYDRNHLLVAVVKEDPSGTKKLRKILPVKEGSYRGLPASIEKYACEENENVLLKRFCFSYTRGGRIATQEVYDAENQLAYTLTYTYDEQGHCIQSTNSLGQIAETKYDANYNPVYQKEYGHRAVTKTVYDKANRPVTVIREAPNGMTKASHYTYDKHGRKIRSVDPYGYSTEYEYDGLGQLIRASPPERMLSYAYDAAGNVISATDAKGYTTRTRYNARGKPAVIKHSDGTTETFVYNMDGTLLSHTDEDGVTTSYKHDALGRLTKKVTGQHTRKYRYTGLCLTEEIDPTGISTYYIYDAAGRRTQKIHGERKKITQYDTLGRPHRVEKGELCILHRYDLLDRVVEIRKEDRQGNLLSLIAYTYDSAGNRSSLVRYVADQKAVETFLYDAFDRLIRHEDPMGNVTSVLYDDHEHRMSVTDPLGRKTVEYYDSHYCLREKMRYRTDKNLLSTESYLYDANDNLIEKKFAADRVLCWHYGPRDRLLTFEESPEKTTRYTYTPTGKIDTLYMPSGLTVKHTYDSYGNLIERSSSDGTVHDTYTYDLLNRVINAKDVLGRKAVRTYDEHDNLLTETFEPQGYHCTSAYDISGRRVRFTLPDKSYISYAYDPLYLRRIERYNALGALLYTHHYKQYDTSEHLLEEETPLGTVTYSYDQNGRPTAVHAPAFNHSISDYDSCGNVLQAEVNGDDYRYAYDPFDNLIDDSEHTYAYDVYRNRLEKDGMSCVINALNQITTFTYDADGNLVQDHENTYTYDALGRMIRISTPTAEERYTYDAFGRRLTSNDEIFFLYDGEHDIGSLHRGMISEVRVLGRTDHAEIGATVGVETNSNVWIPYHDLYGNMAHFSSLLTKGEEYHHYTPFGETEQKSIIPWGFSSKRTDPTGLVHFGKRIYSPKYGRWLTPDPLGYTTNTENLYAFVSNSPLTHFDQYGLIELSRHDLKQCGIGAVHGIVDLGLGTAEAISTIGFGISLPAYATLHCCGIKSLSESWQDFRGSQQYVRENFTNFMQRALPGDMGSSHYRYSRDWTATTGEAYLLACSLGNYAMYKMASYPRIWPTTVAPIVQEAPRIAQKGTIELNRFHRAAYNLSETGQNNIRILRGWAKSKGWKRSPNPHGGPEKWGIHEGGKFTWRLRLKPECSTRRGLKAGSKVPRFDARIWSDGHGSRYINPFTEKIGNQEIGKHISLEHIYRKN